MELVGLTKYSALLGLLGMIYAVSIYYSVKNHSPGNQKMVDLGEAVHQGAMVFLKREYSIVVIFILLVFLALSIFISGWTGIAFVGGASFSMLAGIFGMQAATKSGNRTCQAAIDGGMSKALSVAFKGGAVMGISVAALGLLGLGIVYFFTKDPKIITGFAMGASSIALFARVGGGIYTKSADVGADLVGKIEVGIPEDDPRNPGVIADNVGDCVGDTAGMGADLFESYVGAVVATMAIGATMANGEISLPHMALPLVLIGIGLIASSIGIFSIEFLKRSSPASALRNSTLISSLVFIIGAYLAVSGILGRTSEFWAVLSGLIVGVLIGLESEYFTSGPPIKTIAKSAQSGAAPTVITGLAIGFESAILPILTISLGIYVAYLMADVYGIALSAVGMLSTIGVIMSTDSYGPIADNAGGIAEMSGAGKDIRKITDKLDALGNTTAAIGKGFAIGSAALTALALLSAYQKTVGLTAIDLIQAETIIGLLLGAMMPFLIASLTMKAVGKAADKMVEEIRRQFREIKGLLEGKAKADSAKCIDIVTKGALKEMILPGVLALISPLIVGFLGPGALGGFLAGATACGVLMGMFMANGGGAFDNAKKWIEEGNLGGKGSNAHKAAVVGDTIGDPFKDTSAPSMNILIKLMGVVSLVFAPLLKQIIANN